jgi:hypothetical protein
MPRSGVGGDVDRCGCACRADAVGVCTGVDQLGRQAAPSEPQLVLAELTSLAPYAPSHHPHISSPAWYPTRMLNTCGIHSNAAVWNRVTQGDLAPARSELLVRHLGAPPELPGIAV